MAGDQTTPGTVFRWAMAGAAGVAVVVIGLAGLWLVRDILVLILIALFVAVSLDPAVRWLVAHGVRRPYAVTLMLLSLLAVIAGIMAALGPPLIHQAEKIPSEFPAYVQTLTERSRIFREASAKYGLSEQLNKIAGEVPARVGGSVVGFFREFVGALGKALLVIVLTIYFMADLPRIRHAVPRLLPHRYREQARRVTDVVVDKVGSYMIGNLIISLIAGVFAYVGLLLIGVPFALPLALFVAVTDLIPLIGATLGAAVCIIVAAVTGGIWPAAVLTTLLLVGYQQLENYFVAPRVMRHSMDMPAAAVLIAGLIGATMLGLIGALMAIPIAAAIRAVVVELRSSPQPDLTGT